MRLRTRPPLLTYLVTYDLAKQLNSQTVKK